MHKNFKHLHFVGIGGIGMSALAEIACDQGISFSGSDKSGNERMQQLRKRGGEIFLEQTKANLHALLKKGLASSDITVVLSSSIKPGHPEWEEAKALGCQILHRSDVLAQFVNQAESYAVAGTHGKTTTSSLLTTVFACARKNPSFAIGGVLNNMGSNGCWHKGSPFVFEADESDGTLIKYRPEGAIVTNIDTDHLDHHGSLEALARNYAQFLSQVKNKNKLFCCGDDPILREKATQMKAVTYGFSPGCALKLSNFRQEGWRTHFDLEFEGKSYRDLSVAMPGLHQALNAGAVFGLATRAGIAEEAIRAALSTFKGVQRRCTVRGDVKGILILDDYGHHPTEIKATIEGLKKAIGERRLVAVFQPHRYTRTRDCLGTFGGAFSAADEVFIAELYTAGEPPIPGISHQNILDEIEGSYELLRAGQIEKLTAFLKKGDVCLMMGAGDITHTASALAVALEEI